MIKTIHIKNYKSIVAFLCVVFLSLVACTKNRKVTPAFYHWKTYLSISDFEKKYLNDFGVQKIYVRFFDVDWEAAARMPKPIATLNLQKNNLAGLEIVPTVYITNKTMLQISSKGVKTLAENMHQKLTKQVEQLKDVQVSEMQFDCDWSLKSKERYFELLTLLKAKLAADGRKISATIRLHQIKFYQKTGVPPVDKGMLMFYNMGKVGDLETENSILDLATAKPYLVNFDKYPLQLDLALPIFSWGVVFRRGKATHLLNNLQLKELSDTSKYQQLNPYRFKIKVSHYLKGKYLYKRDLIRIETVPLENLENAAKLLSNQLQNQDLCVTFYHLDSLTLKNYTIQDLNKVCRLLE